jgi:hypothetical protein
MDLETRLKAAKSKLVQQFAKKLGLSVIDIKMATVEPNDMRGLPNEVIDGIVEQRIAEDQLILAEGRRIKVGDMVLMEYAKGVVETVKVEEIDDGLVYGTAEDGEPLCAPIANCDKVPF